MIHLSSTRTIVLTGVLLVGMVACQPAAEPESNTGAPPVLEMTALDYSFAAPDTIRSGWTTLAMTNKGEEHHLFVLLSLPTGKTIGDLQAAVYAPFDTLRSQLHEGAIDSTTYRKRLERLGRSIPEWYTDNTDLMGGVGLTAPGGGPTPPSIWSPAPTALSRLIIWVLASRSKRSRGASIGTGSLLQGDLLRQSLRSCLDYARNDVP